VKYHIRFGVVLLPLLMSLEACEHRPLWAQAPPDGTWKANAELAAATTFTLDDLGAIQGLTLFRDNIYVYGDVYSAKPRVGAIREYDLKLKPTGRVVWLRRDGKTVIQHPTGLTFDDHFGVFLGDTVNKKAVIYRLDWEQAWRDGNLDKAVRDVIDDDAAVNGCRPEFVRLEGKTLLATADYGEVRPEIRLYDPEALTKEKRSSAPGVVLHRVLCGPFNQNLHWDVERRELTCIQNVIEGRGWRLDVLHLPKAVKHGRADGPGVRVKMFTFMPHSELEGFRPFDQRRSLFVTSSPLANVVLGDIQITELRESPGKN
jgi:hypothetical protein